jgi:hypothetical protein
MVQRETWIRNSELATSGTSREVVVTDDDEAVDV